MRISAILLPAITSLIPLSLASYAAGQSLPAAAPGSSVTAKPPVTFQAKSNLVLIDVVLSDKGTAVRGLSQNKFHVYENGVPQKITVFEEHKTEDGLRATGYPPLGPNIYSDFPQYEVASAANVLLLDALNTPLSDQMYVRQQMLEYLKNIPPGTRIAVFTLASRLRIVEGFTTDSSIVAKTLSGKGRPQQSMVLDPSSDQQLSEQINDAASLGASQSALSSMQQFQADLASFQTDLRVQMTLDAMKTLARYLSVIPGRKNLIWFSGSFPLAIEPDATLSSPFEAMRTYAEDVRQADVMLSDARVAVYPVDARGLMTMPSANAANNFSSSGSSGGSSGGGGGARRGRGRGASSFGSRGGGSGGGGNRQSAAAAADQKFLTQTAQEHFAMQQIADETGGEAFVDTNALKDAVARAIADGARYYTVGYIPALSKLDGDFRHIRVDVDGGYQASYRRGYYADDPAKATVNPQAALNPMNGAVLRGAPPLSEIFFKVKILSANDPAAKGAKLTAEPAGELAKDLKGPATRYLLDFAIDPHALGFSTTADGVHQVRLEFAVIAYDADGKRLNYVDRGMAFHLTDALYEQVMHGGIPVHQEIDLPQGAIYLRLVVHDLDNSKVGSTEVPLMVAKT